MLPTDKKSRKETPIAAGCLGYFPDAIAAVAHVSFIGNQEHNPGESLHWSREKSSDHPDCLIRHFMERGTIDTDGLRHSAKVAWRALALLQLEIEADQKNQQGPLTREASEYIKLKQNFSPIDRMWSEYSDLQREHESRSLETLDRVMTERSEKRDKLRNDLALEAAKHGEFDHTPDLAEHTHKFKGVLYVSGPMRGIIDQNFPAFDAAAAHFRKEGYIVVNPADADRADKRQLTQKEYAERDTAALQDCTHIAMLPRWEQSIGATAEYHYAKWIGLTVLDALTGMELK